ncbi:MAG: hypothetical protein QOG30_2483, partial [Acidimicrobiaceae bacterium]
MAAAAQGSVVVGIDVSVVAGSDDEDEDEDEDEAGVTSGESARFGVAQGSGA